jgi:hypothetical protein
MEGPLDSIYEIARQAAFLGGYIAWATLFVGFLFIARKQTRRERLTVLSMLLLVAIAATFLAVVTPDFWMDRHALFQRKASRFGLFAVSVSSAALIICAWIGRLGYRQTSLCPTCSYDLTANESGVCPECGTTVTLRMT